MPEELLCQLARSARGHCRACLRGPRDVIVARDFTGERLNRRTGEKRRIQEEWGHGIFLFWPIRGRWRISLGGMAYFSSGISRWDAAAPVDGREFVHMHTHGHGRGRACK